MNTIFELLPNSSSLMSSQLFSLSGIILHHLLFNLYTQWEHLTPEAWLQKEVGCSSTGIQLQTRTNMCGSDLATKLTFAGTRLNSRIPLYHTNWSEDWRMQANTHSRLGTELSFVLWVWVVVLKNSQLNFFLKSGPNYQRHSSLRPRMCMQGNSYNKVCLFEFIFSVILK